MKLKEKFSTLNMKKIINLIMTKNGIMEKNTNLIVMKILLVKSVEVG